MSDPLPFEKVSVEDAKKVMDSTATTVTGQPKAQEQDWRWARTFTPPVPLKEATVKWLAALPAEVRPRELPSAYPRIANRLCDLWARPLECDQYLDDLTRDRRGRRNGFPASVAHEIAQLKKHYINPNESHLAWEDNIYRR